MQIACKRLLQTTGSSLFFNANDLEELFEITITIKQAVRMIIEIFPQKYAARMLCEMKNADEAKDYGLDVPIYTIEYTDDNDDVISVYFGNNTGDNIYATLKGEKSIYTVSSQVIEDLNYTEEDLIQLDDYPSIGSGNLEKAVITKNKNSVVYDSADETQTEQIIAIAGGLGAVQLSTTADYCAEEKELSEYGLDEDLRAAVEVTYQEDEKEKKLTLYIGNRVGDDRYVMLNDSKIVYLVSDAICGNILNEEE